MQEKNSCTIKNHQTCSRLGGWVKPSVGFLSGSVVKNPPADAGGAGDMGLTPGWRRSPGGGHGSPLQYSCLKRFLIDRAAWQATVYAVTKSSTGLSTDE